MANVTPTSRAAEELHELRGMVARSTAFQTALGAPGDAQFALERVHIGYFFPELLAGEHHGQLRPYAVVMPAPGTLWTAYAGGDQLYLGRQGSLLLYLADNQRYEDPTDDWTAFANFAGGVDEDLASAAGYEDANLPITTITRVVEPRQPSLDVRAGQQELGRWWYCMYGIEWR